MKEIVAYENRLKSLFDKAATITDLEIRAHWARYLCVLTSGYLEVAVRCVLREYVRTRAQGHVPNYVDETLERFQSPNGEGILQAVGRFSPAWRTSLEGAIVGQLKDAADSIVNNRHQIAHGGQVNITLHIMTGYYSDARALVQAVQRVCV
jgi:hypothetical protein